MATATRSAKTVVTTMTGDPSKLTPKAKKVAAVDAYQKIAAKAKAISTAKGLARDAVLDVAKDGDVITASDGTKFVVVDKPNTPTNQHAKVVAALVKKHGVSEAELKKLYKDTAGSSHPREVKEL